MNTIHTDVPVTMTGAQATILREAIIWAYLEWRRGYGAWDQDHYAQVSPSDVDEHGFVFTAGTQPAAPVNITCGTTACIAGHIALEAGATLLIAHNEYHRGLEADEMVTADYCLRPDNTVQLICNYALEVLGLEDDYSIFEGSNSFEQVLSAANYVLADQGHETVSWEELHAAYDRWSARQTPQLELDLTGAGVA